MFDPHDYTVGWICALIAEYVAAQVFLDEEHAVPEYVSANDNHNYTLGKIGPHNVVIAVLPYGEYGLSSAASVARDMLHSFPNVRIGLMVGLGGGAPSERNDIRLGDIVVGSAVFQYDAGKAIQGREFEFTKLLDQPPMVLRTAVSGLAAHYIKFGHNIDSAIGDILERYPNMKQEFGRPHIGSDRLFESNITHASHCKGSTCIFESSSLKTRQTRSIGPKIHHGLIASGDTLMRDATVRDKLATERDILCFEMEAAGLMNHFPCLVIRGICDYADSHKNKDWQGYAAMTAAAYAKDLLCRIPVTRVEAERKIGEVLFEVTESVSRTEANVTMIRSKLESQEDRDILDWLATEDYISQQNNKINQREVGTGQWLFNAPEFKEWVQKNGQCLFCPGMPGAGKTILASTVIDYLQQKFSADRDIGVAFIYFDYNSQSSQMISNILAGLLKQLSQGQPRIFEGIRNLYNQHKPSNRRPRSDSIIQVIQDLIVTLSRVFIVVDALDECQTTDGCREQFLSALFTLQASGNTNIFLTSRAIPEIIDRFRNSTLLEIRARNEDVHIYLDGRIAKSRVPLLTTNREIIKEGITNVVDGMFLLARLHYNTISTLRTLREIKDTLRNLATGDRAYDKAYKEAMKRIMGSDAVSAKIATKVLLWISHAKRPLTTLELQHALAIIIGECSLDEENILRVDDMISACGGMVTLDQESNIVRLVHYTTQDYLQKTQEIWFPDAPAIIAKHCLSYLLYGQFEEGPCTTNNELEARLRSNPLYDYAARNWGHHARAVTEDEVDKLALALLGNDGKRSAASQVVMVAGGPRVYNQRAPAKVTSLHLAAYFGLSRIVARLLGHRADRDAQDTHGQTPLLLAAANGHSSVVSLLLGTDDVEVNAKDRDGRTAVSLAAERGHNDIVQQLIAESNLDLISMDEHGLTASDWAGANGHGEIVQLLRQQNSMAMPVSSKGLKNSDLLIRAAKKGNYAAVKLLIRDIDANIQDYRGRSALLWAACRGHETVVRLLLTTENVDPTVRDNYGDSALDLAVVNNHERVVAIFMEQGMIDWTDETYGSRALHHAVKKGHRNLVNLLLQYHVKSNWKDPLHRMPLWYAAHNGYECIVHLLLKESPTDLNSPDVDGITPIKAASQSGHLDIVKILLSQYNKHSPVGDNYDDYMDYADTVIGTLAGNCSFARWTADNVLNLLLQAAERGHTDVLKHILKSGVALDNMREALRKRETYPELVLGLVLEECDICSSSDWRHEAGRQLLLEASRRGHTAVIYLMLAKGAYVDGSCAQKLTPLAWAAKSGHYAAVQMLLENGSNIESSTPCQIQFLAPETPSYVTSVPAVDQGDVKYDTVCKVGITTWMTLYSYLDPDWTDRTVLSWAAENGDSSIVQLLLERGADVNSSAARVPTPLFWAVHSGRYMAAQVLLDGGANTEVPFEDVGTPLCCAANRGDTRIAHLLLEHGANIESAMSTYPTPLVQAAKGNHHDVVKLLLEKGANVRAASNTPTPLTPLGWAARHDNTELVRLLLEYHVDTKTRDDDIRQALKSAASRHATKVVELLIIQTDCKQSDIPLYCVISVRSASGLQLLLSKGVDIQSEYGGGIPYEHQGLTPLSHATRISWPKGAELLLAAGADVSAASKSCTPDERMLQMLFAEGKIQLSDVAKVTGNTRAAQLLKSSWTT